VKRMLPSYRERETLERFISPFKGVLLVHLRASEKSLLLDYKAEGKWSIEVRSITATGQFNADIDIQAYITIDPERLELPEINSSHRNVK